jgi:hypothetical protein
MDPIWTQVNAGRVPYFKRLFAKKLVPCGCSMESLKWHVLNQAITCNQKELVEWMLGVKGPFGGLVRFEESSTTERDLVVAAVYRSSLDTLEYLMQWRGVDNKWFNFAVDNSYCFRYCFGLAPENNIARLLRWVGPDDSRVDATMVEIPRLWAVVQYGPIASVRLLLEWEREDGAKVFPTPPLVNAQAMFITKFTEAAQRGGESRSAELMVVLDDTVRAHSRWSSLRRAWVGAVYLGAVARKLKSEASAVGGRKRRRGGNGKRSKNGPV